MTISELISSIRGMNKLINADSRITDRFIYSEASSIKNTLLKQEENKQRLYIMSSLFKTINRVDMIKVDTIEACGIDSDCIIMRSKYKLPKIVESVGGYMIRKIASLDATSGTVVTITTDLSYGRKLKINDKHARNEVWAFIRNEFLYMPNVRWPAVIVEALFEDPDEIDNLNSCDQDIIECTPAYERQFPIPNYLEKPLKDLLNNSLLNYYHRLQEDTNINKSNIK